ncbi:MAG: hypothetical protein JSR41_04545 [Proteobacteria bacterium]|nr:hypothetical protein [Pseudomonadota bacterium]
MAPALLLVALALTGCNKEPEQAPARAAAFEPAARNAPAAPVVLQAPSGFPKDCQAYLDRVQSCVARQQGAIADAVRAGAEQTQAGWDSIPPAQRADACKTSLRAFAAQASALGC